MGLTLKQRREVESLTWRYIDEAIQPNQFKRLETLLRDHEEARKQYVDCVMLHVQLQQLFSPRKIAAALQTPVNVANDAFLSQLLDEKVQGPQEQSPSDQPGKSARSSRPRRKARPSRPSPATR